MDANPFSAQATQEMRQAYAPAYKQLSRQGQQIRAVNAKQARDEQAYRGWLATTQRSMNAASAQRDAQLAGVEQGFHSDLVSNLSGNVAAAAQRAAGVGSAGPGVAVSAASAPEQAQAAGIRAQSANLGGANVGKLRIGGNMTQSIDANNFAFLASESAKRRSQTLDAISKLAAARGDLGAKRAADTAKRTSDLQAAAIKAAYQQQQLAATQAYRQATLAQGSQRIGIAQQNANTAAGSAAQRAKQNHLSNVLARQRLAKSGAAKKHGPTQQQQNTAQQQLAKAQGLLGPRQSGKAPTMQSVVQTLAAKGIPVALAQATAFKYIFPKAGGYPNWIKAAVLKAHGIRL